jgi:hypothetical protein
MAHVFWGILQVGEIQKSESQFTYCVKLFYTICKYNKKLRGEVKITLNLLCAIKGGAQYCTISSLLVMEAKQ